MHRILKPGGELLVGMPRVDRLMENLFTAIGFKGISAHHVTSPDALKIVAREYFELSDVSRFPAHFPIPIALYFNMLFKKTSKKD